MRIVIIGNAERGAVGEHPPGRYETQLAQGKLLLIQDQVLESPGMIAQDSTTSLDKVLEVVSLVVVLGKVAGAVAETA